MIYFILRQKKKKWDIYLIYNKKWKIAGLCLRCGTNIALYTKGSAEMR